MLNIGKLAPGGEAYFLTTIASGLEDYYTGAGEAPTLGLEGLVEPEALRAVLGAAHSSSQNLLTGKTSARSVPGFDCTFRAPKSVSLLYGLGDLDASIAVRDAHDAAVTAAVAYLERAAGFSRRGHGGAESVPVTGFIAAAFPHRTSRAGDPLLHTHVLVANLGQAVDDAGWRTLDGRSLYVHAKTAGYLYQAQLRAELTRRLGVEWQPVRNGCADLAGVPEELIQAFSQRRAEIEAHMERRGETSAKAAQVAVLATRKTKERSVEPAALGAEWLTRAAAFGFGPDQTAALLHRLPDHRLDPAAIGAAAQELAGPEGLTARASTFSRRDVIRAWCDRLPEGADVDTVIALADTLLAHDTGTVIRLVQPRQAGALSADQVLRRADGRVIVAGPDEPRYSTPELLALEQRVISSALDRRTAGAAVAAPDAVRAAVARRPSLAAEQVAMVERLTQSGAGVEVVVGKAGAGKTFALDAAREAWQDSGVRVIGCALAARAAAELHAGAGIDSYTIDALLVDLDRPGPWSGLPGGGALVIDEAGMVGTRKLARLLDHAARADAKVVLVGDHHQLPEIDAGGVFRGLVNRLPLIELAENRRQREAWERDALDELRVGEPANALTAYDGAGRVTVGDTAEAVREQLVSDWWAAVSGDDAPAERNVMIAARVRDVDDLNDRARVRLAAAGELTGPEVTADNGRRFQAGDRIVCLHNDRQLGVHNGTRAAVLAVDADNRTLTVQPDQSSETVVLPARYLDAGHVGHGYAITGHKAQGLTTDRAWVLGSDAVYREWGYVALSRGRDTNRLYVVAGAAGSDAVEQLHQHGSTAPQGALLLLGEALRRSRGQHLAVDQGDPRPAHAEAPAEQVPGAENPGRRFRAFRQFFRRRQLDSSATRGAYETGDPRVSDPDVPRGGRLNELRLSDPEPSAPARGAKQADQLRDEMGLRHQLEAAEFDPPDHLLRALGPRPTSPAARPAWREGVHAVETYRSTWSVTDPSRPLGEPPSDAVQRDAYTSAVAQLRIAQTGPVDNFEEVVRPPSSPGQALDIGVG